MLSTIAYAGGTIDTRTYDAGGRLSSETLGNGQVVTRAYLTADNLPALIANAAVGNYTYGWDSNKNKTSETITGAMIGYGFAVPTGGYDDQNRLTAWNRTNGTKNQSWALSAVGDWNTFTDAGVAQTRTHGLTHEILTIGAATVTHDSRGNMTQDEQGKQLTWDADGMLASATVPAGASTGVEGTHTYQYDALGRRVRKTTGGTGASDTVFIRDGQTVAAEYAATSAAASPLRKYVNASYVDEPVLLIDRTAAGSVGAGTDERFYYHRNQQYSITALTDNSGTPVERYAYTAYGEPTILDGPGATTRTASFIGNPYLYTSQEYDAESALYHFNARMYEGRKGRFLSHDPIEYPDGANTYTGRFAIYDVDPSGEETGDDEPDKTHRKKRKSTRDKHQKTRSGRMTTKNRTSGNWRPKKCRGLGPAVFILAILLSPNPAEAAVDQIANLDGATEFGDGEIPPCQRKPTFGPCRCAEYTYTETVPSWWAFFDRQTRGEKVRTSNWSEMGVMGGCECLSNEEAWIDSEESVSGFTIYEVTIVRCQLGE